MRCIDCRRDHSGAVFFGFAYRKRDVIRRQRASVTCRDIHLVQDAHRTRHRSLFAADVNAIAVQPQDDRDQSFKRSEVLIVGAERAQRIDGRSELENLLRAGLRNGYASLPKVTLS